MSAPPFTVSLSNRRGATDIQGSAALRQAQGERWRPWCCLVVWLCIFSASPAFAVEAQQSVQPEKVKVGEPFTFKISVTHTRDERFDIRLPPELGDFEVLSQDRQRVDAANSSTTTFTLKMALFALGSQSIPPLDFEVNSSQGVSSWKSEPQSIEGVSTLPDDAKPETTSFEDIKPLRDLPIRSLRLLWGALAALALAALTWFAIKQIKKLRSRLPVPIAQPVPAWVRALSALDALEAKKLPAKGEQQSFYFRLSEVVRGYIAERFNLEALESTTSELRQSLRKTPLPPTDADALIRFLEEGDLVKFARVLPDEAQCAQSLGFARELIKRTQPPPTPTGSP